VQTEQVLQVDDVGDVTIVKVLPSSITPEGGATLKGHTVSQEGRKVILDLGNLRFLGSIGIEVLVVYMKRGKERNGQLALACLNGECRKVLKVCGLTAVFDLYPDVASALAALGSKEATKG
jgi:anti-anti-sigma factor